MFALSANRRGATRRRVRLPVRRPTGAVVTELDLVRRVCDESAALHRRGAAERGETIVRAAGVVRAALAKGRKVLVFGNGGSAADATHFAAELVGRFGRHVERGALSAVALTTDTAVLTSVANDFGYAAVFARQVDALGVAGDVALAITTSGRSENVNEALRLALDRSLSTIALTGGDGGQSGRLADVHVNVPDESPARVQEVHRTILHVMCELIESDVPGPGSPVRKPVRGENVAADSDSGANAGDRTQDLGPRTRP
jgi:phosphoheptose isomerase